MATIRKRNGKYQVQVRLLGSPPSSRAFTLRRDAEAWGREAERTIEVGDLPISRSHLKATLGDLLARYRDEVTPAKRSAHTERLRIGLILRHPISNLAVARLRPEDIARFRDERLAKRATETVRQDLVLLRQVLLVARKEWGIPLSQNPVDEVRKPPPATARTRRLMPGELDAIISATQRTRDPRLRALIEFAISTAMRRSEILRIQWKDIDWRNKTLIIPQAKNGHSRIIPLTSKALVVLGTLQELESCRRVPFGMTANAVRLGWRRVVSRAGLIDLRMHDLRHESISAFFERGLNVPEVAHISGHRDVRQLLRYTHVNAIAIGRKLD
ncbi:MAG: site-specific integrase [Beijerinckiaceae bacterium]|nr:site-specific integrase [Beijerinckiaceae bacterium]